MFCTGSGWLTCVHAVALIATAYSDPYSITGWYPVSTQTDVKESTLWLNGGFQRRPEFFPALTQSYHQDVILPANWGFQRQPDLNPLLQYLAIKMGTKSSNWGFQHKPESPTVEPVVKMTPARVLELGAAGGAVVAAEPRLVAHARAEPPAQASSTAPTVIGTSPYPTTQPRSSDNERSTPATTAPTVAAQTTTKVDDEHISSLRSTAPTVIGTSHYPTSHPRKSHSGRQTPATAAPTTAAQTTVKADDGLISSLRSLSPEEKGRRLIEAAKQGIVWELDALLAAGADVGARDGSNMTALHHAARAGHAEAARRLLAAGAAVGAKDKLKWTPLHEAAGQGHADVVRLLVAAGADHGARTGKGWTPLHAAAANGKAEAAAALLVAGADVAVTDNRGQTPQDLARQKHHQEVAQLLEENTSRTATPWQN